VSEREGREPRFLMKLRNFTSTNSRTRNGGRRVTVAWVRQGGKCLWCSRSVERKFATAEHLIPTVLGGPNAEWNIGAACGKCNSSRVVTAEEIIKILSQRSAANRRMVIELMLLRVNRMLRRFHSTNHNADRIDPGVKRLYATSIAVLGWWVAGPAPAKASAKDPQQFPTRRARPK
jgi:hypothetical protein